MLDVHALVKTVAGGRRVLDGVTFSVKPGEFIGILGSSGAGKSLTLRAITGLTDPDALVDHCLRLGAKTVAVFPFEDRNSMHRLKADEAYQEWVRQLRDQGMAILFVTHFLDQVYALCDRITVLRNGELVGEYPAAALGHNALIAAMVGRELAAASSADAANDASRAQAPEWLQTKALNRRGHVKAMDLGIRRGEVVGLGGLLGSGRTELARLLFGLDRSDAGEITLDGKTVRMDSPVTAIQLGLGLCPEDRKAEGIIAELSVRENIVLALQARQGLWPAMGRVQQTTLAEGYVKALGIKTADVDTPIGQLSGGNQQKAVLARWLATQPSLLILDEPTRGIDVAAKQEIMNEILALAKQGMAVLFISSEMEEVVRVSDRIVVLRDRAKVGELPAGTNDQAVYAMIAGQA